MARGTWRPCCCDSLFWWFVRIPPLVWDLIGNEKPGLAPRGRKLFNEDWRRGVQALACVLASVSPRRETQVWLRRPDGRPPSRLAFPLLGRAAESHTCALVLLRAQDYMACATACANVCVCWKTCSLERWVLMTFVSSDTRSRAMDETGGFSARFLSLFKKGLLFHDVCDILFLG